MLVALKCARDMLTKMSYKGFEIKDEKDFCKCLLSIVIDYFGSIFHDEDNQHQETIFHHLAQGICYTLEDKLGKGLGKRDDKAENETGLDLGERCQSSSSCVKLSEANVDSLGFEQLNISFDITSLSYAYSLRDSSSHVIFLDTQAIYPLSADLLCKYIYYRSSQTQNDEDEGESMVNDDSISLCSSKIPSNDNLNSSTEDKIEIHRFPQVFDDLNELNSSNPIVSLPVSKYQSINPSQSLLRSLLIPGSRFNHVEIGQRYCLIYLNCDKSILGRSEPFQFDSKMTNNLINSLDNRDDPDSDEDGFVIVES
ncbi:uncharacterized protein LOC128392996 [Panonychus citri]|uniref:uncharacterized protein LOC128392996 n=1 Tax=Panonychus citri TaxID=50023 RepID=UPI0023071A06|nr:uncharacterized protein LOC128392996 [Panonychus citri]